MYKGPMPWDKDFDEKAFREECTKRREEHAVMGLANNERGQTFEKMLLNACELYDTQGRAHVTKIPEPFRVIRKLQAGRANVQFIKHAEPDFMGVLSDGHSIVFEAKYTTKERMDIGVLTSNQWATLELCSRMTKHAYVAAGIQGRYYMVPWVVFSNTKSIYGHKYISQLDIEPFEVRSAAWMVRFLDYRRPDIAKQMHDAYMEVYAVGAR